jgi:DNA (cytosine-5)-methyltransferase 1
MNKHKFSYKWRLADGYPPPNGLNVFGTFICGGGSTMGYKLAGFNHLGGVEIDKQVAQVYRLNHKPKHLYNMDIREFNQLVNLPDELYNLDILDGSPPCSTFSTAGSRENAWGKKKKFREGQASQTLDDLVFVYCDTIIKLQPKVFILENVTGIIKGNAKAYSKKIVEKMTATGYSVQVFCLNAATMGVPQMRERVFFIGSKATLGLPRLSLAFSEPPITYGMIEGGDGSKIKDHLLGIWLKRVPSDLNIRDTIRRESGRESGWGSSYIKDGMVCNTIVSNSGSRLIDFNKPCLLSDEKLIQIGTFPTDYDFAGMNAKYLIGMSVPPVMTAQIASELYRQWFSKIQ